MNNKKMQMCSPLQRMLDSYLILSIIKRLLKLNCYSYFQPEDGNCLEQIILAEWIHCRPAVRITLGLQYHGSEVFRHNPNGQL